ncbi:MAG: Lrp/AsnC family transcriptional regulator [Methanomicrobia archaeon]|nr:Lrp/AsnC family transcriptional regulator [Methanomicrobia archaeon]
MNEKNKQKSTKMDLLNYKILEELSKNSRITYRKISKTLKKNPATIFKRIKSMEEKGIIKRYSIDIDFEKLGYTLNTFIKIRVTDGNQRKLGEMLRKYKNVDFVYEITGEYDLITKVRFKTAKELDNFVNEILKSKLVERTNTMLIVTEY